MRQGSIRKTGAKPTPAGRARKPPAGKVQTKAPVATGAPKRKGSKLRKPEKRLTEPSAEHAAISEILRVMCASRGDVRPVLDAVAERAARLCEAPFARVSLVDGDVLRAGAEYSIDGTPQAYTIALPLKRSSIAGRSVLDRSPVHHADVVPLLKTEYPDAVNARRLGVRAVLAVPLIHEGEGYGAIFLFRREPNAFSPSQVALVETFAQQAAIAIENVRLFNETKEALEQQTAISEILRVISSSPTDVQPMLNAVVERAAKLCEAANATIFLAEGDKYHSVARFGDAKRALELGQSIPLTQGSAAGRAMIDLTTIHLEDVAAVSEDEYPMTRQWQRIIGHRTLLAVPLLREERAIGALALWRMEVRPFTEKQISLVKTFTDQAVIAIENVRLFNETKEALERQTATSEILRAISKSPTDVQPVFDTIAAAALKLCGASSANVFMFDGELIHLVPLVSLNPGYVEAMRQVFPRVPSQDTAVGRAILTCSVVAIVDVLHEPEYRIREAALAGGFRSVLALPLIREKKAIGAIAVGRPQPGLFPEKQIALLQTFADQAVIAIENVRLFKELGARNRDLTEALEQQTATSEILRVISRSPRDVQPVFDTIAAAALKLCNASTTIVTTFDGGLIHVAALANLRPEQADAVRQVFPRPPSRDNASARAVLTNSVVLIPDVSLDPDYVVEDVALKAGFRAIMAVPLIRGGNPIGAITVGRPEAGTFSDNQIALLKTFADQAVIAVENVRLFTELEVRTVELTRSVGELKALGEVGQAVSSTLDLETVLSTIVSRATQLAAVDGGSIYEYDTEHEEFHVRATYRLPDDLVEAMRTNPVRKGEGLQGRMAITGEPVEIPDIADAAAYQSRVREPLIRLGYRSLLAVPLLRENHLLGGLAVNRKKAGAFDPQVIELLKTFATQSALAIQNARLYREIEVKSRELQAASRHKSEFLANMSHELRTPLNAIIGFSEVLSERLFGEINEKQAEYISDILQSGQHLLSLINDILDLSKIEAGRMELEVCDFNLPSTIEQTLMLVRERAVRRGITLARMIDERLELIRADERKVKQVLLNLLSNALKFTPEGGQISVHAAVQDGVAEVSVTDTGVGIAAEDQEKVFEEFQQVGNASKKVEGTGLGLAISRKFIELHGGKIWVRSQVGSGSTFAFSLPL